MSGTTSQQNTGAGGGRQGQLTRLYDAAFDRAPDSEGLAFWTNALNGTATLDDVADIFVASAEFQGRSGSGLSDRDFVSILYRNALEREADPEGLNFWTTGLQRGVVDRGGVALALSESPEGLASPAPGAAGTGTATTGATAGATDTGTPGAGAAGAGATTGTADTAGAAGTGAAGTGAASTGAAGTAGAGQQGVDAQTSGQQAGDSGQGSAQQGTATASDADAFNFVELFRAPDGALQTVTVIGDDIPVGSEVVEIRPATADDAPDAVAFFDAPAAAPSPELFV